MKNDNSMNVSSTSALSVATGTGLVDVPAAQRVEALAMLVPAFSVAVIGLIQGAGVSQGYPNPDGK